MNNHQYPYRYYFLNTPRTLSWATWDEFLLVAKLLQDIDLPNYTDIVGSVLTVAPSMIKDEPYLTVLAILQQWESRGKVPFAINTTSSILDLWYTFYSSVRKPICSVPHDSPVSSGTILIPTSLSLDYPIRLSASLIITRFINTLVDAHQTKQYAQSIAEIMVKNYALPRWLIDIRHDTSHNSQLPTLAVLYNACHYLFTYLRDNFWKQQRELITSYVPLYLRSIAPSTSAISAAAASNISSPRPILRIGGTVFPSNKLNRYINYTRVRLSPQNIHNNPINSLIGNHYEKLRSVSSSVSTTMDTTIPFHPDLLTILRYIEFSQSNDKDDNDMEYMQRLLNNLQHISYHHHHISNRHRQQILKSLMWDTLLHYSTMTNGTRTIAIDHGSTSTTMNSTILQSLHSLIKVLVAFHLVWKDTTLHILSILHKCIPYWAITDTYDNYSSSSVCSIFTILTHLLTSQYWYSYLTILPSLDMPTLSRTVPLSIPNLDVLHSLSSSWTMNQRQYLGLSLPVSLYFGLYRRYSNVNNNRKPNNNSSSTRISSVSGPSNITKLHHTVLSINEDYCMIDELIKVYDLIQQLNYTFPRNRYGITPLIDRMEESELQHLVPKPWILPITETPSTVLTSSSSLPDNQRRLVHSTDKSTNELSLEDMEALLASPSIATKPQDFVTIPSTPNPSSSITVTTLSPGMTLKDEESIPLSPSTEPMRSYRPSRVPRWRI